MKTTSKLDEVSQSLKSSILHFSVKKLLVNYRDEKLIAEESYFTKFTENF